MPCKNMYQAHGFSRIAILCTAGLSILVATGILFSITPAREKFLNILTSNIAIQSVVTASPASFMQAPLASSEPGPISQSSSSNQVARILGDSSLQSVDSKILFVTTPPASSTILFMTSSVVLSETKKQFARILISQILLEDGESSRHEFVELYNPNDYAVDLSGWELRKKTETGTDSVLVSSKKFAGTIASHGYFLISNPEYSQAISADEVWSSVGYGISKNNTVYITNPDNGIADLVGFGEAQYYEGASAQNPGKGIALARVSSKDTNMNQNDFVCATPEPRNTKSTMGFRALETVVCANQEQNIVVSPVPSPIASPELSPSPVPSPTPTPTLSPSPSPLPSPSPSASPSPLPSPSPSPQQIAKILITEVQTYPVENRFIELYNQNNFSVDLTGWYLQRKTQSGVSFGSSVSKTHFEGKTINANSYFLISRSAFNDADIVLSDLTLTESNTIQLKNLNGEVVDKVGWGQATDCENSCAQEPPANQSLQRKLQGNTFIDTDNNASDFEITSQISPKQ